MTLEAPRSFSSHAYRNELHAAADYVHRIIQTQTQRHQHHQLLPTIAIVLGSGLSAFADEIDDILKISYANIPFMPQPSVSGHAGELVVGTMTTLNGPSTILCFSGRVHSYEGWPAHALNFITRLCSLLNVKVLLLTNSAGGTKREGDIVLITDHIRFAGLNPLREGADDPNSGLRSPNPDKIYSKRLIEIALKAAEKLGIADHVHTGVYGWTSGPTYETPSEVIGGITVGAGAFGMSTVPEVCTAAALNLEICAMSLCTNLAAGLSDEVLTHEGVKEVANQAGPRFQQLLRETIKNIDVTNPKDSAIKISSNKQQPSAVASSSIDYANVRIEPHNFQELAPLGGWTPSLSEIETAANILRMANVKQPSPSVAFFLPPMNSTPSASSATSYSPNSELHPFLNSLTNRRSVSCTDFPPFRRSPMSASARTTWLHIGTCPANGARILVITGMAIEGFTAGEYAYLLQALAAIGVSSIAFLAVAVKLSQEANNNELLLFNDIFDRTYETPTILHSPFMPLYEQVEPNNDFLQFIRSLWPEKTTVGSYAAFAGPVLPTNTEVSIANKCRCTTVGVSSPVLLTIAESMGLRTAGAALLVNSTEDLPRAYAMAMTQPFVLQFLNNILNSTQLLSWSIINELKLDKLSDVISRPIASTSNNPSYTQTSSKEQHIPSLSEGWGPVFYSPRQEIVQSVTVASKYLEDRLKSAISYAGDEIQNELKAASHLIPSLALFINDDSSMILDDFKEIVAISAADVPYFLSSALTYVATDDFPASLPKVTSSGLLVQGSQYPYPPVCALRWRIRFGLVHHRLVLIVDDPSTSSVSSNPVSQSVPNFYGLNFMVRVVKYLSIQRVAFIVPILSLQKQLNHSPAVLIRDHLNLTGTSSLFGPNVDSFGLRFPDAGDLYSREWRKSIQLKLPSSSQLTEVVCGSMHSCYPFQRRASEEEYMRLLGAHARVWGLTEATIVARHCALQSAAIGIVTESSINLRASSALLKPILEALLSTV